MTQSYSVGLFSQSPKYLQNILHWLNCLFFSLLRTANLLSKFLKISNGTLDEVNEELFFLFVRNNVHGDSLIFGSAIALERGVYRYSIPSCVDSDSFQKSFQKDPTQL